MKHLVSKFFIYGLSTVFVLTIIFSVNSIVNPVRAQNNKELADEDITVAVKNELKYDDGVQAHLIDVETHDGIVTLSGSVANILAKDRAEKLVGAIKGVKSIVNNIEVKSVNRTDEQIQRDVENALLRNPVTETYEVEVEVEDNKVILTGEVGSRAEKTLTEKVAKGIKGIQKFENNIDVEYEGDRTDSEITEEIKRKLESSVWIDDALIEVNTLNGRVTLSGTVGSALEKSRVYNAAWVAGVKSVNDDNLEIEWWAHDNMRRQSKYAEKTDKEVKKAVKDAFIWDPRIVSFGIEVEADNGEVILKGVVDNYEAKRVAEEDAKNTIGVVDVENHLKVRPTIVITDEEITQKIKNALLVDPVLEQFDFNVNTINNKVYLYGRVNSLYEKNRAEDVASRQIGVVDVENKVRVDYDWERKADAAIKNDVEDQLFWSFAVDDDEIEVEVDNGIVILGGKVDTKREENLAVKNAFDGGAKKVRNNLDVKYDYDWIEEGREYEWLDYQPYRYWPYYPW